MANPYQAIVPDFLVVANIAIFNLPSFPASPPPPVRSLASLFAKAGTTGEAVAPLLSLAPAVDPELFRRVDNGRQPLPVDVAEAVAGQLGLAIGTVLGAAKLVTYATGPIPRVPIPPDPLLGDDFLLVPLSPLVPPPPGGGPPT